MHPHSQEYEDYIQSAEWKARRECLFMRRGRRCERCGFEFVPLEIHHKTYARLGHERDSDLEIVCQMCHPMADKEREDFDRRYFYQMRVNTWAAAAYGVQWFNIINFDIAAERFENIMLAGADLRGNQ